MDRPQNLSIDYLDLLPDEILLEILFKTDDLKTLSKWCQTSKRVNQICQDKFFWKRKYQKDFGLSGETTLFEGDSWVELYKRTTLFGVTSPISAGFMGYGVIDQNGDLYMSGINTTLGIERQPRTLNSQPRQMFSKSFHLVKFPIKVQSNNTVSFPAKVLNVFIGKRRNVVSAVTRDGRAFIWGSNTFDVYNFRDGIKVIRTPKEIIIPNNKKAIKMEVGRLGYIILLDDYSVYLRIYVQDKINFLGILNFTGTSNLKIVDISIGSKIYAIITKNHKLYIGGDIFFSKQNKTNKLIPIRFPGLVKRAIIGIQDIMILSTSGEVYTWAFDIPYSRRDLVEVFKITDPELVKLPEPIVQISTGSRTFAALSKSGKLYMWGRNFKNKISSDNQSFTIVGRRETALKPVEISFGVPITSVSVGNAFTIAVSDDGMVNYWGTPGMKPE